MAQTRAQNQPRQTIEKNRKRYRILIKWWAAIKTNTCRLSSWSNLNTNRQKCYSRAQECKLTSHKNQRAVESQATSLKPLATVTPAWRELDSCRLASWSAPNGFILLTNQLRRKSACFRFFWYWLPIFSFSPRAKRSRGQGTPSSSSVQQGQVRKTF